MAANFCNADVRSWCELEKYKRFYICHELKDLEK